MMRTWDSLTTQHPADRVDLKARNLARISEEKARVLQRQQERSFRMNVTRHAIDRFQERFDSGVTRKEAHDLLVLAYQESVPCPRRLRPHKKLQRGCKYRYHKEAGLVILVKPPDISACGRWTIVTCWVMT